VRTEAEFLGGLDSVWSGGDWGGGDWDRATALLKQAANIIARAGLFTNDLT